VGVLTAVGGALRFGALDGQSFWLDELVTVSLLDRDFAAMLREIRESEATPYLYYVVAWPWSRVAGLGEIGLRSLSAAAGTATIPVAYGAGAALATRRVGVLAAALVAVHPFLTWYALEARSYALLILLGACSVLFLGRALRDPSRWDLLGWGLTASLALATHYFAVFLVAAEAAWLLARYRPRRDALAATLVPALVLLAHVPLLLAQRGNGEAVASTSLTSRIGGGLKALVVGYSFPLEVAGTLLAGALVLVGLVLAATRTSEHARAGALVAGSIAAAAVAVPVALAVVGADYLSARNLVLAVVPGAVCLAAGYATSRLGLAAAGALLALLLAITVAVALDDRYGRTDWRGAADRLQPSTAARAIVVTPYMSRFLWRPYLQGLEEPSGDTIAVREIAVVGLATEGGLSGGAVQPPDAPPPAPPAGFALTSVERTPTLVLVTYRAPAPTAVSESTLAALRLADQQPGILLQPGGGG
jgi:mannosyltransferase